MLIPVVYDIADDKRRTKRFYWIPSDAVPKTLTIGSAPPQPPPNAYII